MPGPIIRCCERDDVIKWIGGADAVAQLLDPQRTGTYDTALLDKAIEAASGDVAASCGNQFKIWAAVGAFPQLVVRLCAQIAAYWVWYFGTNNKSVPEKVERQYERTMLMLEKIETNQIGLGADVPPPARKVRGPIENSDCGERAVHSVVRRSGFLGY